MRILFIKQLFTPEPTARALDFAKGLAEQGHEVQVLTGFPSYPYGKIYEGYKQRLFQREMVDGVELIRIPIFPDQSKSGLKRMLNYVSYLLSVAFIGVFLVRKADVAFAYHGAITVGIAACIIKFFRGIPFVYDINDIWPDTLSATGMMNNKSLLGIVNFWCGFVYKRASIITVLSHGFKRKLIERGVEKEKIEVIHHWSRDPINDERVDENTQKEFFPSDKINFLFAGNIGAAQSMESVLRAVTELEESHPQLNFVMLGSGVELENLQLFIKESGAKNVKFHPRVSSDVVSNYLQSSDKLVVHLKNKPLFEITIPSKILAYLKTGKPILMGLKGDAAEFLHQSNAGLTCIPDDVEDIKDKIISFVNMPVEKRKELGNNGKRFYSENLAIDVAIQKYLAIFENVKSK